MIFPYSIKYNGEFYKPGQDVPMTPEEEREAKEQLAKEKERQEKYHAEKFRRDGEPIRLDWKRV